MKILEAVECLLIKKDVSCPLLLLGEGLGLRVSERSEESSPGAAFEMALHDVHLLP